MTNLCQMLKIELNPKIAELNPTLTLDDVERIAELDRLARIISDKADEDADRIAQIPVPCGSALFKAPTIGAILWYDDKASAWFSDDETTGNLCFAYLLTGADVSVLRDRQTTKKVVRKWARKALKNTTATQLGKAIETVLPKGDSDNEDGAEYGPLIDLLLREYGSTPHFWLYQCETNIIAGLVDQIAKRNIAEHEQVAKMARQSGNAIPPPVTHKTKALAKYKQLFNNLVESWQTR